MQTTQLTGRLAVTALWEARDGEADNGDEGGGNQEPGTVRGAD